MCKNIKQAKMNIQQRPRNFDANQNSSPGTDDRRQNYYLTIIENILMGMVWN